MEASDWGEGKRGKARKLHCPRHGVQDCIGQLVQDVKRILVKREGTITAAWLAEEWNGLCEQLCSRTNHSEVVRGGSIASVIYNSRQKKG